MKVKNLSGKLLTVGLFSIFLILLLISSGCRITLVPDYDDSVAQQIIETAKRVDKFYLNMLETTTDSNGERAYNKFADTYVDIEVELVSLLNINKVRPLNENSTRICEIALEIWTKYKNEHKEDDTLSDEDISGNRDYLNDLFYSMLVAEEGKKIADTNK